MFRWVSNKTVNLLAILSQHRSPNQIAWGAAIGVAIGVIPKDNLVVLIGLCLLLLCRVNQLVGCMFVVLGGLLSPWMEPMTSAMGAMLLTQAPVVRLINRLYEVPILPWLYLENTRVLGGLVMGMFCLLPSYFACRWTIGKSIESRRNQAVIKAVDSAIAYRQSVLDQAKQRSVEFGGTEEPVFKVIGTESEMFSDVGDLDVGHDNTDFTSTIAESIEQKEEMSQVSAVSQLRVMLPKPRLYVEREPSSTDTILRETVIEVVRYRRPKSEKRNASRSDSDPHTEKVNTNTGNSMTIGNVTPSSSVEANSRKDLIHAGHTQNDSSVTTSESSQKAMHISQREESLKYLLSHLAGHRETAKRISGKTA